MADEVIAKLRVDISDVTNDLNKVKGQMANFSTQAKETAKSTDNAFSGLAKSIGPQLLAAFSVGALTAFAKQVITLTGEFQKMQAVLTNTLGSNSAAQFVLKDIQKFAAETNFGVQELTQSYVKLANQGFKPTVFQLRQLADLANSTGKSFDQLTEAIIDAQTGEFERLKEFGIRAQKEGDKVTFSFKGIQTQTDFTNDSIRKYILSLGDLEGVTGSTEAISQTLTGQISNLGDAYDRLVLSIGNLGNEKTGNAITFLTKLSNATGKFFEDLDKALGENKKVLGENVNISGFTKEAIEQENKTTLEVAQAGIDSVFKIYKDKAEAYDVATAKYQKEVSIRLSQNAKELAKEIERYDETVIGKEALGISVDPGRKESLLIRIFKLKEEKKFLENELPEALKKYRDEINKTSESTIKHKEKTEKLVGEYEKLTKSISVLETKIKDDTVLGIFNKDDINKLSTLKNRLSDVNLEIERIKIVTEDIQKLTPKGLELDFNKFADKTIPTNVPGATNSGFGKPEDNSALNTEVVDRAQQTGNTLADIDRQLRDQRIQGLLDAQSTEQAILDEQYEYNLKHTKDKEKVEADYQKKTLALQKETAEEIRKEKVKQFYADQALAITNIAIDTAQAIMSVTAKEALLAPFLIPGIVLLGAAQSALVLSQQPPKARKGGRAGHGLLKGNYHEQGGVLIEAEKDEYIMPRGSSNKWLDELESMRNGTFERLMQQKYVAPNLKKQKDQYEQSMASNIYKSIQLQNAFNDGNLLMSDRTTRAVLYDIRDLLKEKPLDNIRFKNV